jgi:hypothetical protein
MRATLPPYRACAPLSERNADGLGDAFVVHGQ